MIDSLTEQLASGLLNSGEFGFLLSLRLCTTQVNVTLWLWWYCQAWKWHFNSKSQSFITFSEKCYLWGPNFSCSVSVQDWTGFRNFHKNQPSCSYFFFWHYPIRRRENWFSPVKAFYVLFIPSNSNQLYFETLPLKVNVLLNDTLPCLEKFGLEIT